MSYQISTINIWWDLVFSVYVCDFLLRDIVNSGGEKHKGEKCHFEDIINDEHA